MAKMKVVLAYSGGLDTTIIIPWLKEHYDCEVIAVAADVGQGEELSPLNEKAIKSGASKIFIEDLKDEFVKDCIFPTIKAGAVYEGKYLLGTSFARPVIAKRLVEIAKREKADAICHGCTGKGNDQVRFELTIKALAPDMKIIAPWRIWDIKSRDEEIDYALARGLDVPVTKKNNYSMDRNLWHLSHEGSDLEDPKNAPKDEMLMISRPVSETPDKPELVEIEWVKGEPVAVNGKKLAPVALIETLNEIGARHGVGVDDMVENRLVGMKSRGVYENPAGSILYAAHKNLEELTLDRDSAHFKEHIALKFAELVYDGKWYTPLREALSAFVDALEETVTGKTTVKLFKGKISPAGMSSPYSLYDEDIATFGADEVYDQKDSAGFINLFGLPLKVRAKMLANSDKKQK